MSKCGIYKFLNEVLSKYSGSPLSRYPEMQTSPLIRTLQAGVRNREALPYYVKVCKLRHFSAKPFFWWLLAAGNLGPVYGFQWRHFGADYINMHMDYSDREVDQLAEVIHTINTNSDDRRIIMLAWAQSVRVEKDIIFCTNLQLVRGQQGYICMCRWMFCIYQTCTQWYCST